ncbi:hypothetical protein KKF84_09975 [Myxococcota bacterium]|nr:hypothetical protein [Myxococcota bacterium]MBU1535638.1 hypothetical protein [Myxococcota bacterium]
MKLSGRHLLIAISLILLCACETQTDSSDACGDGVIDTGEACDSSELGGATCQSEGFYDGQLACTDSCSLDFSGCSGSCGDGVIDPDYEACDNDQGNVNLGGKTCESLGYHGGELACDDDCQFDLSACQVTGRCGDGLLQTASESCDGTDLGGATCLDVSTQDGILSCNTDCTFNTSACNLNPCGNGTVDTTASEECDGTNLNGETCDSLGYYGGNLACDTSCKFNLSQCAAAGSCGDGILHAAFGESCDGIETGGETCESMGYYGGNLACDTSCEFDLTDCRDAGSCGDGILQAEHGEECEPSLMTPGTRCMDVGFFEGGSGLFCNSSCKYDGCASVTKLSVGLYTACASTAANTYCWGDNEYGQLGFGATAYSATPLQALDSTGGGIAGVAVGYRHVSAVTPTDNWFYGWGDNTYGTLGDGTVSATELVPVDTISPVNYLRAVEAGYNASCALTASLEAACWGSDSSGLLGNGAGQGDKTEPFNVVNPGGIIFDSLSMKNLHACALDLSGNAWCWGNNLQGQLGIGTAALFAEEPTAVTMPPGRHFVRIATGQYSTCAIDDLGGAWCWGSNDGGQLGNNSLVNSNTPVAVVAAATVFVDISPGHSHACGVTDEGVILCWGNSGSHLGCGFCVGSLTPISVTMPADRTFVSVSCGTYFSCAIDDHGAPWCWGRNNLGQLGRGVTSFSELTPAPVLPNY